MKKILRTVVMLAACLIVWQNLALADGPTRKLRRGLANIATGWLEVFATPKRHCEDRGWTGVLTGIPAGIGRMIWRTSAGAYETITFPLALPEDYQPIIEPEFMFEYLE